jgi:biopolymer transport protein ExbB/TolQ
MIPGSEMRLQQVASSPQRASGELQPGLTFVLAAGITAAFYGLVVHPLAGTYFSDLFAERGWVPYAISVLSSWAGVVLFMKLRGLQGQRRALELDLLPRRIAERITPEDAAAFVAHLDEAGPAGSLLVERLRRALHHFEARRDAREVVDQLGTQAQSDADAVESSYTMVRVFIWAVPILGFIGTVIGIGAAVGGFSESVGAAVDLDVMKESIGSVTTGLGVAFDTTLLALVMSILIMFPSSALQKAEEDHLVALEEYCDERLVRRLDDGAQAGRPEDRVIRDAIAREMQSHHSELRAWLDRLGQIGEVLTTHVVSGWEKIDEQQRVRQDQQLELLGRWTHARQRESSEELAETQRSLLRDFRSSLEGMAAESRRIQEESAHRLDEQLASIERLHRRLQEDQQSATTGQREQSQAITASAEQLARTLTHVRNDASQARDEGARQLTAFAEGMREVARSAQEFQRGMAEQGSSQAGAMRESSDRLSATLTRIDEQLEGLREASAAQLAAGREQLAALDHEREESRRQEAQLREAQLAALRATSEDLATTLEALRGDARAAQSRLHDLAGGIGPELARQLERLTEELAEPWRRQIEHLEQVHGELARRAAATPRSRARRFFSRS